MPQSKIDHLANVFLIGKDVSDLDDAGKSLARNVTRSIFVLQQGDQEVTVDFVRTPAVQPKILEGPSNPTSGLRSVKLPYNTTVEGDFDVFVTLTDTTGPDNGWNLFPRNETSAIQRLQLYANGINSGNSTAYLVPSKGVTIVSDIDDILRVTKIYVPWEGILNTFANPFTPWMNMPSVYANWSASIPNFHFHYLTTTPEQISRNYMDFVYRTYPLGSFDTRPLNFSDPSATLSIRKFLLKKIFDTFPKRKFILIADTSNFDVMKDYPAMYHEHPDQVLCILLRNTSATDPSDHFPYNTKGFQDIPQSNYMFFRVPDDLRYLDISNGQCYNTTIKQNVTFSEQGIPFGLGGYVDSPAGKAWISKSFMTLLALGVILFQTSDVAEVLASLY